MTKSKRKSGVISNRRVRYDYSVKDELEVGIVLTGAETKALRNHQGNLTGAYVIVKDDELFLVNAKITGSSSSSIDENEQTRTRKLLAKKREIGVLDKARVQGLSILPSEILTGRKYIKLRIVIGQGKKRYDKRATLKARDDSRRIKTYKH
ncbi:MAG TPA: SsrA-binding protein SmpB [Candidatus Saccharimonadales bacterium]|nr:SsrA-binding protein SmpB [Candidatus Saccharimonadales bacterium]